MKRNFYAILLIGLPCLASAQTMIQMLDANAMRVRFRSNGLLAPSFSSGAIHTSDPVPLTSLYSGGLWISGKDSLDQYRLAAQVYGSNGHDMYSGPLPNDGTLEIAAATVQQYDRLWKVTRHQMEQHQLWFACSNDPSCDMEALFPNGYIIPQVFLQWPAMGDPTLGQDQYIAPFHDANEDGMYDPAAGDMPCVPGDQALFMVFNDVAGPHAESGGLPMGIEVQLMAFAYYAEGLDLSNTVFLHYRIINRSTETFTDVHISNYSDFDLGCPDDDVVGTDVQRNAIYTYNGSDIDASCQGVTGFGANPPALGMLVLKGPRVDPNGTDDPVSALLPAVNGSGFGDGIVDNERHGLSNSMHYRREGNPAMTEPSFPANFLQYQRATWKNGIPLTHGGNGYSTAPDAVPTVFPFPGDSDPLGAGTNGVPQGAWVDVLEPTLPDPRMLGTMGPFTFAPGDVQEVLLAYVQARATEGGAQASLEALKARMDQVRAFTETIPGMNGGGSFCQQIVSSVPERHLRLRSLQLYPNPAADQLWLDEGGSGMVRIIDARGMLVRQERYDGRGPIAIGQLAPGLYRVVLENGSGIRSAGFVKE
jgi:hypothetical protein